MTSGPILLEDGGASHCHGVMQVLTQDVLVEVRVHPGIPREDVEPAQLPVADGTPDHEFGWVLHGGPQELGLVGIQDRAPPHTAVDPSATSPLLHMGLIREENLAQLLLGPVLVLVGPGFPPLDLKISQKRLLLGHMRGQTNPVKNGPVNPLPADLRQTRNHLAKLVHSEAGVVEKPPLDGGNHPSGQLLPLSTIRSSLPVGRLERQPVPVPRSLRSSHPTPPSRWRNTSEILDFFGVDVPSFLQQQHRFPRSGRCVFVCLSCRVD